MTPDPSRIPEEWKRLLSALHAEGAQEAVIQGGSLRDLFNHRAVKDVDFFLKSRGSTAENAALLRRAFNAAGIRTRESELKPNSRYLPPESDLDMETWYATNADTGTLYNFVCFGGLEDDVAAFRRRATARGGLGVSQIAFDGDNIITTPHYEEDVAKKQLVVRHERVQEKYIQRIAQKYPGWPIVRYG